MALIHWWPLNGDTKDYGLSPCTVSGTPGFSDNGKIGKALGTGTLTMPANAAAAVFNKTGVSICFWFYNAQNASKTIFGTSGMTQPNNRRFTLFKYPNATDLHWSWQNYNSDSTFTSGVSSNALTLNAWNHICAVWDNGTARLYVNGSQVGTSTGSCITETWTYDTPIAYPGNGDLYNDVRIYNHALSVKEVKDIAKGLVLHYNFEDEEIEPTLNKYAYTPGNNPYWSSTFYDGATGKYGYNTDSNAQYAFVTTADKNGNQKKMVKVSLRTARETRPYVHIDYLSGQMANNTWATVSLDMYSTCTNYVAPYSYYSGYYFSYWDDTQKTWVGGTGTSITIPNLKVNAWNHIVYRIYRDTADYGSGPGYLPVGVSSSTSDYWLFDNVQVELGKDHPTPYVNGSRQTGLIYDNSGFNHNGTLSSNNAQIVEIGPMGLHAILLDQGTTISHTRPVSTVREAQEWTINAWVYPTQSYANTQLNNFNSGNRIYHSANGNALLYLNSGDNDYYRYSNAVLPKDQWSMVTMAFKNSTGDVRIYYNGVDKTGSGPNKTSTPSGIPATITMGTNFVGYIADFKIYATALSAADILKEYQSMANVDKKYNLSTYMFNERFEQRNLLTSDAFLAGRVNTSATTNVGEWVTRNGRQAMRVGPSPYWSGDAATSANISKGNFQSGSYVFDLYLDVDDIYYDGISNYVPGGLTIRYTDGSSDTITASRADGNTGWRHVVYITPSSKTISGLGVYYYIGTPAYYRDDCIVYKKTPYALLNQTGVFDSGYLDETDFTTNFKTYDDGRLIARQFYEK